jgi:threonine synthase
MSTQNSTSIQDLPDELKPCDHMVNLVSRRSDGTLVGPAKWYTDFHVMTCPHCRAAVKGLQELRHKSSKPQKTVLALKTRSGKRLKRAGTAGPFSGEFVRSPYSPVRSR